MVETLHATSLRSIRGMTVIETLHAVETLHATSLRVEDPNHTDQL